MSVFARSTMIIAALFVAQASTLFLFGQPPMCACGYVKFWEGVVLSSGNSQHLLDWYTFSHVVHGFLFYALLWYFFPRMPIPYRLALALGIEITWELAENTPYVIELYRQQALAQGYSGDSILNSLSDSLAAMTGFLLAWRLPVWSSISLSVAFELFAGYFVRDNLTLNVMNFIHQFDFISKWQSGE